MLGTIGKIAERKPKLEWVFEDNKITGIIAGVGWVHGPGLILPHGLTDEQRDLILWAWEAGNNYGFHEGKRVLRTDLKRLLEIYD